MMMMDLPKYIIVKIARELWRIRGRVNEKMTELLIKRQTIIFLNVSFFAA